MHAHILGLRIEQLSRRPTTHRPARCLILRVLLCVVTIVMGQARPAHAQAPTAPVQRRTTKSSSVPDENRLRVRLQFNPHDAKTHEQLKQQPASSP